MEIFLKLIWNINNLTSDTMLKWKDMRSADINKLYVIQKSRMTNGGQ
jgi:hypothetical protein